MLSLDMRMKLAPPEKSLPALVLWNVAHLDGVKSDTEGADLLMVGPSVDNYLFAAVLAKRLEAGDIEIVEKGDSIGKKAYYDRLLAGIERRRSK